jgi:hypothetical protein
MVAFFVQISLLTCLRELRDLLISCAVRAARGGLTSATIAWRRALSSYSAIRMLRIASTLHTSRSSGRRATRCSTSTPHAAEARRRPAAPPPVARVLADLTLYERGRWPT